MKKIIFAAAALFAFGFANAQDKKESEGGKGFANGDVFISGSFGISSSKEGDLKTNGFEIMPRVGFFVSENIAIGGQIGYESTKVDNGVADATTNALSIGAFGRYYMTPASDFSLFGQLGVNYRTAEDAAEVKTNGFEVALAPGVSYFLSDNWAIEASIGVLGFSSEKEDVDGAENRTTFGLGLDMEDINFGLIYKF